MNDREQFDAALKLYNRGKLSPNSFFERVRAIWWEPITMKEIEELKKCK